MPYVLRDPSGAIESLHRDEQSGGEYLPAAHAEVQAFVGHHGAPAFDRLDADFVRVLEDLIDTLIIKNVLNITDLPEQAQAKLLARKSLRERVARNSLRLFELPADFGDVV